MLIRTKCRNVTNEIDPQVHQANWKALQANWWNERTIKMWGFCHFEVLRVGCLSSIQLFFFDKVNTQWHSVRFSMNINIKIPKTITSFKNASNFQLTQSVLHEYTRTYHLNQYQMQCKFATKLLTIKINRKNSVYFKCLQNRFI